MLQRSQTLYLLGVFILTLVMMMGPIARFTVEAGELVLKHSGLFNSLEEKMEMGTWPLTVIFILVAALSFLNVFSYRNRTRQMRLCIFLMLLCVGVTGMMFFYTWIVSNSFETVQTLHQWRFVIPPICIIMLFLAFRMIRRDELMVKAYDRIR